MRNSVPQSCTCGSQCEKVLPCVLYDVISLRVATCAIFRRKVRYVRSICGVRWSALRVRSICCVSIKYEFLFDKSRKISINIM